MGKERYLPLYRSGEVSNRSMVRRVSGEQGMDFVAKGIWASVRHPESQQVIGFQVIDPDSRAMRGADGETKP
jgi:hypothetical protein